MSSARIHHSLPAPVVHAGFSVSQSKSTVLAGVQDAYWSDDEGEDADCPLCLEEMDISDLNFKPCVCGYQICRFCWHHIKENLNGRCPACRRVYTDDAVEFKPIPKEDHKRLTQQKKQKEREKKELDAVGRRHLANVRVVQRNVVYVVGIAARFAKEELISTLRSNEFFGQYGKITKMLLVKRTPSGGGAPVVGLYITYHRREDAARCIAAVDGTAPQGGGRDDVMRASYGTTKYCMAFLRGVSCNDHACMNLHEWGDEKDCFTKEDLTTLKHTMKATERRSRGTVTVKKGGDDADGLPRAASWGQKGATLANSSNHTISTTTSVLASSITPLTSTSRQTRRGTTSRPPRSSALPTASTSENRAPTKSKATSKHSQSSTSRPATPASAGLSSKLTDNGLPAKPVALADIKVSRQTKEKDPLLSHSPAPSTAADSEFGSAPPTSPTLGAVIASGTPDSVRSPEISSAQPTVLAAPPGLSAVPPGLPAPPGLSVSSPPLALSSVSPPPGLSAPPGLTRPTPVRVDTASPQTPLLASHSSYQMSTAARALLDDVKARRENIQPSSLAISPFPDFDRMLDSLGSDSGFSFNLDPTLAGEDTDAALEIPELAPATSGGIPPYQGNFIDTFPGLRNGMSPGSSAISPPGLTYPRASRALYNHSPEKPSNYSGSFNPFSDAADNSSKAATSATMRKTPSIDDDGTRQVSRFGFARGRRGSSTSTTATASPSPLHMTSSLQLTSSTSSLNTSGISSAGSADAQQHSFYKSPDPSQQQSNWPSVRPDFTSFGNHPRPPSQHTSSPAKSSPLAQQVHAQALYAQQQHIRFQPFENSVSEAQLRDLIQSSRIRTSARSPDVHDAQRQSYVFTDPAIMSARFAPQTMNYPQSMGFNSEDGNVISQTAFGPPPGISYSHLNNTNYPHLQSQSHGSFEGNTLSHVLPAADTVDHPTVPIDPLSTTEFPALSSTTATEHTIVAVPSSSHTSPDVQETAATKPLSATEVKAKELAEKKAIKKALAAEKAIERQRVAQEKATAKNAEKARLTQEKAAEKERLAKEKSEKDRLEKEKVEKEKQAKEKALKAERERAAEQAEKARLAKLEKEREKSVKKVLTAELSSKHGKATANKKSAQPQPAKEEPISQAALLSKKPKKNKPIVSKPIRVAKEEDVVDDASSPALSHAEASTVAPHKTGTPHSSSNSSRAQSIDRGRERTTVEELLEEIEMLNPAMDLLSHPFFDMHKINPAAKMPLEYGPLVHALSALSVGGGSFANNLPSGSIDNAVSSFQQLLETLTQTISDLLRLLPRTTWDDSSSFDGVLRDMLKGDDFLDDGGEDGQQGKEDEVAALTLALERRARWMEVQLSKLEELHRDINTAAVRAVLCFNDSGWDCRGFLPRVGNTLRRFDNISLVEENGIMRPMTADELESKLIVAKEAAVFAETEMKEMMERMLEIKPMDVD